MDKEEQNKIIEILKEKGVNLPCPRCGSNQFQILDGYFNRSISKDIGNIVLGGKTVPTVGTVCNNCGYIAEHALGALGLLDDKVKDDKDKTDKNK